MAADTEARFVVSAQSRHPRVGRDYLVAENPPRYSDAYLRPAGYRVAVDAFPGALVVPAADQQARPGQPPPRERWQLRVPAGTVAFTFELTGQPERRLPVGPLPQPVSLSARKAVATSGAGRLDSHAPDAPWKHTFQVPAPGSYTVTVTAMTQAGSRQARSQQIVVRDLLIVSIGDSAASGEGNPDTPGRPRGFDPDLGWFDLIPVVGAYRLAKGLYDALANVVKKELTTLNRALSFTINMDPEPVWLEKRAHRSLLSGHALAARMIERARPGTLVTFLAFARSGASIRAGLVGEGRGAQTDAYLGNLSEIDEVARAVGNRRIEALLIHIGINDIGVTDVLNDITLGDGIIWFPFAPFSDDAAKRAAVRAHASTVVREQFPVTFAELAAEIASKLNVRHVYLCEYPTGLFDDATATPVGGCGLFTSDFDLDVTGGDATALQDIANELNAGLRTAARDNRWFFVGNISNRLRGRGYCTDVMAHRAFIQAEESLGLQGDTEGTVHPNGRGHQVIAEEVSAMVLEHTIDRPAGRITGPTDDRLVH